MRNRFLSIFCVLAVLLFVFCGEDNPADTGNNTDTDPVITVIPTIPADQRVTNPTYTNTPLSDLGVGPNFIPDGSSDVGTSSFDDGSAARMKLFGDTHYFWGLSNGVDVPLCRITNAVTDKVLDIEVLFNPDFTDNTYGVNQIGWSKGHTWKDLYHSDHVQIAVQNGAGDTVFKAKLDLISMTDKAPSGYACLGPFGGDGLMQIGDSSAVLSFGSSMDDNINYYGYHLFTDSPQTDSLYTVNPDYPFWQYFAAYRISLDPRILGTSGFGSTSMTYVHASPSKTQGTISVVEKPGVTPGSPEDPFRLFVPKINTDTPPDTGNVDPGVD